LVARWMYFFSEIKSRAEPLGNDIGEGTSPVIKIIVLTPTTRTLEAVNAITPKSTGRIASPTPSRACFSHIAGLWSLRSVKAGKTIRSPTALQLNTGEESVEAQFRRADIDANV